MTTKLTVRLEKYHPLQRNNIIDDTKVRFFDDDVLTCDELFTYFIRSALSFGFTMDSVKGAILGFADEYGVDIIQDCGSSDRDALIDVLRKGIQESEP